MIVIHGSEASAYVLGALVEVKRLEQTLRVPQHVDDFDALFDLFWYQTHVTREPNRLCDFHLCCLEAQGWCTVPRKTRHQLGSGTMPALLMHAGQMNAANFSRAWAMHHFYFCMAVL